jgi:hypothetical protein
VFGLSSLLITLHSFRSRSLNSGDPSKVVDTPIDTQAQTCLSGAMMRLYSHTLHIHQCENKAGIDVKKASKVDASELIQQEKQRI